MGETKIVGGAGITAGGDVSIKDNTGQIAIGKFITQFKIEKPSGEALLQLIDSLDKKRQKALNKEILDKYTPSELPDYPSQLKDFVTHNRADEITKAMIYLQNHRILLISGIGGVGKTTLARALVETRPSHVPLPFWFDFSKKMDATLGDVLEKLAGYMNVPDIARFKIEGKEAGQDDINRLTGELKKREQLWLVFDNLETILDDRYFHDQGIDLLFTSLRNSTHNAKIIVTSRTLPLLRNEESLIDVIEEEKQELRGLKIDFAIDYLKKNGLAEVERKKLEELANGVDGHPLALKLLIELVKRQSVSDILKDLGKFKKRKEDTIKKARRLFDKLAGDEKELLEHISVFRQPESIDAINNMFTDKTSEDAVDKLLDKSLLETDHKGKYWLHPLVKEFAYDDLKNKIEVHKLACQYYLSLPLPERTTKEDVQPLMEAHYHACKAEEYDLAANIIFDKNLHKDLDRWGNYRTLVELYTGVLPKDHLVDEQLLKERGVHGCVLANLGTVYRALGDARKAIEYLEKALKIAQDIGDKQIESACLGKLGNAYYVLSDIRKAIEYYEKALKIAQDIGDEYGEGTWFGNLGNSYYSLGDVRKAIEYYEKALKIAVDIGDRRNEGAWFGNLGNSYYSLGDVRKAIEYYEKALKIAVEIEDKHGEGAELGHLGGVYRALGDARRAIEYFEKALKIAQDIGDRQGEGMWFGNLGNSYYSLGDVRKAIEYYEKALKIAQDIGDRQGEGMWFGNLGNSYYSLGDVRKAIEYYEEALKITQEIGDRQGEGVWFGNVGNAYRILGNMRKAIEYYEKALKIAQEIGDRRSEGACLNNLGAVFENEKKYKDALACYLLAKDIRSQIEDPDLETTESNLKNLEEKLNKKKFEKLAAEAAPRAEEIVMKMLGRA